MPDLECVHPVIATLTPDREIAISTAMSLKRIADALEQQNELTKLMIDNARKY